jgi:lipopolysaccharide transport system permease protein
MTWRFSDRDIQRRFDLLVLLTHKEFALKYKRTTLGILWSLFNPILTALVFFVAFKIFMRFQMENYTFFLLTALFPWSWFSSSVIISSRTLVDNVSLIKKMIFPRHYLVASVILAQMAHFLFSIPILMVIAAVYDSAPSPICLLAVPLILAIQFIFTFGISLIVSIANTYFRDIEYLVSVLMNLVFWMTPIIYPMTAIPEKYRQWALLNPLTSLMNLWRSIFIHDTLAWGDLGIAFSMAGIFLAAGFITFRRLEKRLDEVL